MNQSSYGKVSAEAYEVWFPEKPEGYEDTEFYKNFIIRNAGPALEIGCGDGRLLIPYVQEGLEVEGLDLSPHMLAQCRKRALKKGLRVTLHEQAMQSLNINKKFSTIYVPYGSFMLLSDIQEARLALEKFNQHLTPNGTLLISLFLPFSHDISVSPPEQNTWRIRRENMREDGCLVKCWEKSNFDMQKQIEHSEFLYEIIRDEQVIETEKEMFNLRWYRQSEFKDMLQQAGFSEIRCLSAYTDNPADPADIEFTFVAKL